MRIFDNLLKGTCILTAVIMLTASGGGKRGEGEGPEQFAKSDAEMHDQLTTLQDTVEEIMNYQQQSLDIVEIMIEIYGEEGVPANADDIKELVDKFMEVNDDYAASVADNVAPASLSSVVSGLEDYTPASFATTSSVSTTTDYGTTQIGLSTPLQDSEGSGSKSDISSLAETVNTSSTDQVSYLNELKEDRTLFRHLTALEGFATALSVRQVNINAKDMQDELNQTASDCETIRCDVQVLTAATLQTVKRVAQLQALDALIGQFQAVNTVSIIKLEE